MKYTVLFLGALFFSSCYGKKPEPTGKEGKILPSFQITLVDSITQVNTKDIKMGKSFVFFLFGPHCPYSKAQMEDILEHNNTLHDVQFYIITPFPFDQMKEFYQTYNLIKYTNMVTGIDPINFFGDYIGAKGVPLIAVYGKDKKLKKAFMGKTDISNIEKAISE